MKLSEIHLVTAGYSQKRFSLSDFDIDNGTKIGYSERGTIIVKAHSTKDDRVILYGLFDVDNNFISGVIGYMLQYNNTNYFSVLDVFTNKHYRKQGYATALYVSLVNKYGLKLLSDKQQTHQGKALWDRISKVLNVKVFDAATNQTLPRNQVSDEQVYMTEPDRYLLVAEHIVSPIESIGIPLIGDGIVEDYPVYTNSNNIGLYE